MKSYPLNIIKTCIFKPFLILLLILNSTMTQAQHVWWNDQGCGDIMEIMVNVSTIAPTTYYETLGWNQVANAGGYTGIQTTSGGQTIIFSLWDPTTPTSDVISPVYVNPNGVFKRFGGEGTGAQYLNYKTGWNINQWYLQFVRAWPYQGSTYFGMWLYDVTNKRWTHHITMDFPVANVNFCRGAVSFLENYGGTTPSSLRHMDLTGGWKRLLDGRWYALNQGYVDGALTNYGAGLLNGYNTIYMQTGVSTKNNFSYYQINYSNVLPPFDTNSSIPYISSQSTTADTTNATVKYSWQVDPSQNPQFGYRIVLVNKTTHAILQTIKDIDPEKRSVTFTKVNIPIENLSVIANITDIYDIEHTNSGW